MTWGFENGHSIFETALKELKVRRRSDQPRGDSPVLIRNLAPAEDGDLV
jgi:hypothetical protein